MCSCYVWLEPIRTRSVRLDLAELSMARFGLVVVLALLAACGNVDVVDEPARGRAVTTTIALTEGPEPGESTPSDYSNPAMLPELEGLNVDAAVRQVQDRGWTTILRYTTLEYESLAFDADFVDTRLILIYELESQLVLQARVG